MWRFGHSCAGVPEIRGGGLIPLLPRSLIGPAARRIGEPLVTAWPDGMDTPSPAATIERAHSLANEAIHMVALQRRRLQSEEPEDEIFVFRRWADFQFFIVSLRRLRQAALLAAHLKATETAIEDAIRESMKPCPDFGRCAT